MKFKTTRKAIVNGSSNIVCAGYCDLSHLLTNHSPIAYTCGVYGWNFDVYERQEHAQECTDNENNPVQAEKCCLSHDKQVERLEYSSI